MAGTETITLRLVAQDLMSGNVSKAIGSIDKLARRGGIVGSVLQGVGQSMGQMLNPAALVANGIGAVADALGDATTAFREDQLSQTQLRAALEANIPAWDGNTDAIEDVIAARMKLGFSDDEQRASLALLVAQIGNVNDALAVQRTAMDLARLKGSSLADSATLLAKAYNGSSTGLAKMGIKLEAGAKGMRALGEVQKRVAGQAEDWGKTSAGAAAAFDVKVGELQENIGSFLDGAGRGFLGFLSGVVDVIDGPDGVEKSLKDVADEIYRMGRASEAASVSVGPMQRMTDELNRWRDTLNLFEGNTDERTFDWLKRLGPDTLRNFGPANMDVAARIAAIGHAVQETGGDFSDFAAVIRRTIAPSFNVLTSAWTGVGTVVETTTNEIVHHAGRIRAVPFQMLQSLTDVKAEWKASWKNLAEWAKHPFRPEAFERWVNRQVKKALENANDPENSKRTRTNWRKVASAMKSPILAALVEMGMSLDEAVAKIIEVQELAKRVDPLAVVVTGAGGGNYTAPSNGGGGKSGKSGRSGRGNNNGRELDSANVTVVHIGSLNERDGADLARTIDDHLQRHRGRKGGR